MQHFKDKLKQEKYEEKFYKENFRVSREMRDEILVYESILLKFWPKMVSKCKQIVSKFGF